MLACPVVVCGKCPAHQICLCVLDPAAGGPLAGGGAPAQQPPGGALPLVPPAAAMPVLIPAELAVAWTGPLKTQVRVRLLEGLRPKVVDATWEKFFSICGVDVGVFVALMESVEGAVRLATVRGSKPGQIKMRYAILDYISLKKFCNFFELVKAGVVPTAPGRWGDNLRLNPSDDIIGCMLPLVFTLVVTDFGGNMRLTKLVVSYCVVTIPYISAGQQVTLATDSPVEWEDWPLLPPFASTMHPYDAVAELVLEHLVHIHAHQHQQALPPGEDELHYLRIPQSMAQGAAAQLAVVRARGQGGCHPL